MTRDKEHEAVRKLAIFAIEHKLPGYECLTKFSDEELADMYNGIGADWMPDWSRKAADNIWPIFLPCALIHDVRYATEKDRSRAMFYKVNDDLRKGCLYCADHHFAWWRPSRYLARRSGKILAQACDDFGFRAWKEAYNDGLCDD